MNIQDELIRERVLQAIGNSWPEMDEATAAQSVAGIQLERASELAEFIEKAVLRRLYEGMATRRVMPLGIRVDWWRYTPRFGETPSDRRPGRPDTNEMGECVARAVVVPVPEGLMWERR